jgi:hypothetical protein
MKVNKIIHNIIGKKKGKDSDMDGVIDKKDCQPKNTMRQDRITRQSMGRIVGNISQIKGIQYMSDPNVQDIRRRTEEKMRMNQRKVKEFRGGIRGKI